MSNGLLEKTSQAEFEACYSILSEVTDWLNENKIHQWLKVLPKDVYIKWQSDGFNYNYKIKNQIGAIASLVLGIDEEWVAYTSKTPVVWLYAFAVSKDFRKQSLGKEVIQSINQSLTEPIWLTCVSNNNYLPDFYKSNGYFEIAREFKDYGEFGSFEMVLMNNLKS